MENTLIIRLRKERDGLYAKMLRLESFYFTDTYKKLPFVDKACLRLQHAAMRAYKAVVKLRLERIKKQSRIKNSRRDG